MYSADISVGFETSMEFVDRFSYDISLKSVHWEREGRMDTKVKGAFRDYANAPDTREYFSVVQEPIVSSGILLQARVLHIWITFPLQGKHRPEL
jgi:hypothetical protein